MIRDFDPTEDLLSIADARFESPQARFAFARDEARAIWNGLELRFDHHTLILRGLSVDDLTLDMFSI